MRMLVILLAGVVSLGGCRRIVAHSEEHLIPKNYVGSVVIVYGQPGGVPLEIDGNTIVYRVPRDGIIRIRDPYPNETGWRALHYFYAEANDRKEELPRRVKGTQLGVFGESIGTMEVDVYGRPTAVTYESYVVGRPGSRPEWESIDASVRRALATR
jgi:hypothetical protein